MPPKDYVIGVSSGIWSVVKKEEVLGISKKLQWIATSGTNHVQVDLETINEFKEPDLKKKVERAKKDLNISFGIHGEARPIVGMDTLPLDSGLIADYRRSHERMMIPVGEISILILSQSVNQGLHSGPRNGKHHLVFSAQAPFILPGIR